MSLIVPIEGEALILSYITNTSPTLRLFVNNIIPGLTTSFSDVVEQSGSGYASIVLSQPSWTIVTSGGITTASYPPQVFTFTGPANIYGYYVTDGTPKILWIERFTGAPFVMPSSGGTIQITVQGNLSSS